MRLFWGLVNIPLWNYRQTLTIAQIELLASDTPIVVYDRKDDKKTHNKREMDDLVKRWQAKKQQEESKGEKFSLNAFLRTGELKK